ncbi:MAG: ATP-binding cassette domain-containing protein [Actinomycetota bacterium]|nr:ATP-binding cassette domain-containing protein [Actinomycetota bacterium]
MTELLVETNGLTKRYGEQHALDRVNLTVRPGEVYGFLGPNGAGKTTTLRILLGLVKPTEGVVRVLGAEPGDPGALARIGMLVESAAFYPYMSGRDNLRTFARYCEVPDTRADEVLEIVSLTDRAGDRFSKYSLGMKQRLGLAAALLKDPNLLILDEPTNGLDPAGMADMRVLIRQLGRDRRTVLLSSHMLGEVQQVCDRVGMIARGKLVREGTVDELRGGAMLMVGAEPLGQARELVERMLGAGRVTATDTMLQVRAEPDDAVRINRELVLAGIAVSTLNWVERSLEEIFFEVTDGAPEPESTPARDGV